LPALGQKEGKKIRNAALKVIGLGKGWVELGKEKQGIM
jgi:hypothetical protein